MLYVGKSQNLRERPYSYRVANPERLPRQIVRLLFRVHQIEFDDCETEAEATEQEVPLICVGANAEQRNHVKHLKASAFTNTQDWRNIVVSMAARITRLREI